mgnify:CR=1 FL=1
MCIRDRVQTVARRKKNNVILVGESGVGKTAIAEGLAHLINEDSVPDIIKENTIYSLDIGALLAGTSSEEISKKGSKKFLKY